MCILLREKNKSPDLESNISIIQPNSNPADSEPQF